MQRLLRAAQRQQDEQQRSGPKGSDANPIQLKAKAKVSSPAQREAPHGIHSTNAQAQRTPASMSRVVQALMAEHSGDVGVYRAASGLLAVPGRPGDVSKDKAVMQRMQALGMHLPARTVTCRDEAGCIRAGLLIEGDASTDTRRAKLPPDAIAHGQREWWGQPRPAERAPRGPVTLSDNRRGN